MKAKTVKSENLEIVKQECEIYKAVFLFVENLSIIASPKQRSQPWDVTIINSKYGQHYLYACSWIFAHSFVYEEFLRFVFTNQEFEMGLCLSKVATWPNFCILVAQAGSVPLKGILQSAILRGYMLHRTEYIQIAQIVDM